MTIFSVLVLFILGLLAHGVALAIYRLFFHPLVAFPGPKLTAITKWYETYFDVFKAPGGTFMYEIEKMHERYGPIVRISPDELHVKDSKWVHDLYCHRSRGDRDKYKPAAMVIGMPSASFGTVQHEAHRRRKAAISGLFSKASISRLEPMLQKMVGRLCQGFLTASLEDREVELGRDYLAMTIDAICQHTLGKDSKLLTNHQRASDWKKTVRAVAGITPFAKQFVWVVPLALRTPVAFLKRLVPNLSRVVELYKHMRQEADAAILNSAPPLRDEGKFHGESSRADDGEQRGTIFESCLASDDLSEEEKCADRLAQEAFAVIVAGGEASARTLSTASFHIAANKDVLSRLRLELEEAFPDPNKELNLNTLEKLPWLTAVIKESLRITPLVVSRLPLVDPSNALVYRGWEIPSGTPVSMSLRDVLLDASIFEQPTEFRPERWLAENPDHSQINKFHVPFGRGSRMCIGLNLAMAEHYLVLGSMFRRFDVDLYETTRERDVDTAQDRFLGEPAQDSPGIRVKLRPVPGLRDLQVMRTDL